MGILESVGAAFTGSRFGGGGAERRLSTRRRPSQVHRHSLKLVAEMSQGMGIGERMVVVNHHGRTQVSRSIRPTFAHAPLRTRTRRHTTSSRSGADGEQAWFIAKVVGHRERFPPYVSSHLNPFRATIRSHQWRAMLR